MTRARGHGPGLSSSSPLIGGVVQLEPGLSTLSDEDELAGDAGLSDEDELAGDAGLSDASGAGAGAGAGATRLAGDAMLIGDAIGDAALGAETALPGEDTLSEPEALAGETALADAGESADAVLAGDVALATESAPPSSPESGDTGDEMLFGSPTWRGAPVVTGAPTELPVSRPGITTGADGDVTDPSWFRTTPSGRTSGSLAPAITNPPSPTPSSAPPAAATFQLTCLALLRGVLLMSFPPSERGVSLSDSFLAAPGGEAMKRR